MTEFDYERKVWGANQVSLTPTNLGYLHLKYALEGLRGVKGRVLDLGCGAGGLTEAIKNYRPDLEVWGIDISQKVVNQAKKARPRVNFKVASVYKTGFVDSYFDAVVAFDVFEHLDYPKKAVVEVHRVLKKKGIIHSYTPCEGEKFSYTCWVRKLGWRGKEIYCGHIQSYTFKSLKQLFIDNGFKIIQERNSGYLLYQLTDFLFFSLLLIKGKNLDSSVETLIEKNKTNFPFQVLGLIKRILSVSFFIETSLFSKLRGFGLHLTIVKE